MMDEDFEGLLQRILYMMDKTFVAMAETDDSVSKAAYRRQLCMLFEILAPYGTASYNLEDKQYVLKLGLSGPYTKFPYRNGSEL
jgi:hypothetical protein